MKKTLLLFLLSLALLAAAAAICLTPLHLWTSDAKSGKETVQMLSTAESPDGKYVAEVYLRMGGGAAGYVLHHVSLRYSVRDLDPRHYVYWGRGAGEVEARWDGARRLVIRSSKETRFLVSVFEDVQVTLEKP